MLDDMNPYSPDKQAARNLTRKVGGQQSASQHQHHFTPSASSTEKMRHQGQGPKITGIGTGSVAADHTLTLIFDSDEEIHNDTIPGGVGVGASGGIGDAKGG